MVRCAIIIGFGAITMILVKVRLFLIEDLGSKQHLQSFSNVLVSRQLLFL